MLISKFDLMLFSPHLYGVGFRGDYEQYYNIVDNALDDYFAQYFAQKRIMSKTFGVRD